MAVRVDFPVEKNQIRVKFTKMRPILRIRSQAYMKRRAKEIEKYMKANHPWRNRTGNAERGLKSVVTASPQGMSVRITCSHSVPYGIYLEEYYEKRFAIIEPTIRIKGPSIVRDINELYTEIMLE